jgi:outer membrane immunogenic protein
MTDETGRGDVVRKILFAAAAATALWMVPWAAQAGPPVPYNWTGFYLGTNGGYGWGQEDPMGLITNRFDRFNTGLSGGMFGGTFGAQIQMYHVLLGLEGDGDWTNFHGSTSFTPTILGMPVGAPVNLSSTITSVSTLRTRVGWAQENWLFYGTGGVALLTANVKGSSADPSICAGTCSRNRLGAGVAAGLGVEYGFAPNWSMKAEYMWIGGVSGALTTDKLNTIRVGLDYRFGGAKN